MKLKKLGNLLASEEYHLGNNFCICSEGSFVYHRSEGKI